MQARSSLQQSVDEAIESPDTKNHRMNNSLVATTLFTFSAGKCNHAMVIRMVCAHACIHAGYSRSWTRIEIRASMLVWVAAKELV